MSVRCPQGHDSDSTDYCDICGSPIGGGAPASAPVAAPPTAAIPVGPEVCPNCSFPNEAGALFCENCGYDFTTGSLPEADPFTASGAVRAPGEVGGAATPAGDPAAHPGAVPAGAARAAEGGGRDPLPPTTLVPEQRADFDTPVATTPPAAAHEAPAFPVTEVIPATGPAAPESAAPESAVPEPAVAEPSAPGPADPVPAPAGPAVPDLDDPGSTRTAAVAPPPPAPAPGPLGPDADPWIAELWIDPEWYAEQRADDPLPSAGPPTIVVLRERTQLVGRPSVSRGIAPQIDCGTDSGVSRRHCQLNTDGTRWWVEDLQSSNGTFLAPAGSPLPQSPIAPGQRREIAEGDRLYVGAWTRIVLRRAYPGEV